jgi:hypothetical protein
MVHLPNMLSNSLEFDSDTEHSAEWRMFVRTAPTFGAHINATKAQSNANGNDMFSLPFLWSLVSKTDELRRFSQSITTADHHDPLKSLSKWMLCDLSTMIQFEYFSPCKWNHGMEVIECAVSKNCRQFAIDKKIDAIACPREEPVVRSAIHDIGIPGPCKDIVYLLIDDLLHMSEVSVDKYYRVWRSSGASMLVSSTTSRHFNDAGNLIEVCRCPVQSDCS